MNEENNFTKEETWDAETPEYRVSSPENTNNNVKSHSEIVEVTVLDRTLSGKTKPPKQRLEDVNQQTLDVDMQNAANGKRRRYIHQIPKDASEYKHCKHCSYKTKFQYNMNQHNKIHRLGRCDQCEYSSNSKLELRRHKKTHVTKKLFSCETCKFNTDKKARLTVHLTRHLPNHHKPFACDMCEYRAGDKCSLLQHKLTHLPYDHKPFSCDKCEYRAIHKSNLARHAMTHVPYEDKPFACHQCTYRASRSNCLKVHMRSHSSDSSKLLACEICNFKCLRKSTLTYHVKKHDSNLNRGFPCDYCEYKTLDYSLLENHVLMEHLICKLPDLSKGKPFTYDQYDYKSARNYSVKYRQNVLYPNSKKLFICEHCDYRTSEKYRLRCHMRTHKFLYE